jgi:SNF2 family DNA or RNA helicase
VPPLQDRVKFHVLLTTYEMLSKHLGDIKRLRWSALIVDEAHRLKSAASKLFQVRPSRKPLWLHV